MLLVTPMLLAWSGCSDKSDEPAPTGDTSTTDSGPTVPVDTTDTADTPERPIGPWTLQIRLRPGNDLDATDPLDACVGLAAVPAENPDTDKPVFAADPSEEKQTIEGRTAFGELDPPDDQQGFLIEADRCKPDPARYPTATALLPRDYEALRKGDIVERSAYTLTRDFVDELAAQLGKSPGDLKFGFVMGWVRDSTGAPVTGATVTFDFYGKNTFGSEVFYFGEDPDDWFATDGIPNTTTLATGRQPAGWVVPVGPLAVFGASHPDPSLTFDTQSSLMLPAAGAAVFVEIRALP